MINHRKPTMYTQDTELTTVYFISNMFHSVLIRSNKMQQYAGVYLLQNHPSSNVAFGHVGGRMLLRYYDLYQRLQLHLYVPLIIGAIDTRNM